ncbi:acyl-CoA dehydrogenase [Mycolicibacterium duvalii]|uniref:Acyl-CoA dehydrogenase n=1 Tax=Mycolicibacterium duvalii TaxID=39688 RepID=A0A7I7JYK8_9MYCO|nr:acyl-CoA dehydrogenase family protein [Mycolicibacterium duvalii]MCV7369452.1 acyl-CoA dehydrogenase family protein [Mycolicibacterium duvalii]PEG42098.1 acyl-CoA dehydrogenase [Mycolicibacterium duvalii]BBX16172.1 acyl-CoA dehydrogenase [Mycolicibacterium duvalii]
MELTLSGEQKQLVDSFAALYARESSMDRVRAAEPLGFDPKLWRALCDTGVLEMAVGEQSGGWGSSVVELALIADQFGRAVASAPVIEAQVAARLLSLVGAPAEGLLAAALNAEKLVVFAPRSYHDRTLQMVPAGAVADVVVACVGGRLLAVGVDGDSVRQVENLGALPLADLPAGQDAVVLAEGPVAERLYSGAVDVWLTLTAAALAGAAARAVDIGAEYAKQRTAFGTPIGAFQAVSHPLADSATASDGARLLTLEAACSFDDEPTRTTELAAMAFAFAYETARDATRRSLHVHGGYGFGMEGDIQLYYRRARAWALVYGDANTALDRVADARYGVAAS